MINLEDILGFDWDEGNREKNWLKHKIANSECEEVFFNQPLLILPDQKHSKKEFRLYALGMTNNERLLFIAFTIRKNLIRVISARDISKKERRHYE